MRAHSIACIVAGEHVNRLTSRRFVMTAAWALTGCAVVTPQTGALVGSWKLVSIESVFLDGEITTEWMGPKPILYVEEFHNPETRHCKFWLQATLVGGSISVEAPEATAEYIVAAAWHTEDQVRSLQVFPEILQARYWQDRKAGFSSGFSIWACAAWSSGSRRCAVWPNPSLNPRPATAGAVSRASASRTIVAYRAYSTRLRGRG